MTASRMIGVLLSGSGYLNGGGRPVKSRLDEELADPFGDQSGLFLAFDLDRHFIGLLPLAGALFFEFEQLHMAANGLARAAGDGEADIVDATVDAHFYAFDLSLVGW